MISKNSLSRNKTPAKHLDLRLDFLLRGYSVTGLPVLDGTCDERDSVSSVLEFHPLPMMQV